MQKFTIFTAILTVIIVVIVAEIMVTEFFPELKKENSLGEQYQGIIPDGLNPSELSTADVFNDYFGDQVGEIDIPGVSDFTNKLGDDFNADDIVSFNTTPGVVDFEGDNYVAFSQNVFIREDQIRAAGFTTAYLEDQADDGYLFKNIYVSDIPNVELKKTAIRTADALLTKVYILKVGPENDASNVFEILKFRSSEGLDIEINLTNEYGEGSFYMNDTRRPNVAFLTVRVGSYIYGFSYPKQYHPQVKNLIQLIDLEF
ncbi:hypothetical protein ACFL21_05455 [Patescibacteria group bacterium]